MLGAVRTVNTAPLEVTLPAALAYVTCKQCRAALGRLTPHQPDAAITPAVEGSERAAAQVLFALIALAAMAQYYFSSRKDAA